MIKQLEKVKIANVISIFIVSFICSICILLMYVDIPHTNRDIFNITLGFITGTFGNAIAWYLYNYKKGDSIDSNKTS